MNSKARIYTVRELLAQTFCRGCGIPMVAKARGVEQLCATCYHGAMAVELIEAARWHLEQARKKVV